MTNAVKNVDSTTKTTKPVIELAPVVEAKSLYTKEKDIVNALLAANKAGNSLQVEYQRIAVSLLQHLATHKDIRIIRHFFGKLDNEANKQPDKEAYLFPASMFMESMAVFMESYGNVKFAKELVEGKYKVTIAYDATKEFNLDKALKNAWWKEAKQTEYKGFNELDKLGQLLTQAKKKLANPDDKDFVTSEFVNDLEQFFKEQQFKVKKAQAIVTTDNKEVIAA